MGLLYSFIAICLIGFSFLQAVVGLISYMRAERKKLLFVSLAFVIFGLKGIYALLTVYTNFRPLTPPPLYTLLLDFVIIALLYLSIIKE